MLKWFVLRLDRVARKFWPLGSAARCLLKCYICTQHQIGDTCQNICDSAGVCLSDNRLTFLPDSFGLTGLLLHDQDVEKKHIPR